MCEASQTGPDESGEPAWRVWRLNCRNPLSIFIRESTSEMPFCQQFRSISRTRSKLCWRRRAGSDESPLVSDRTWITRDAVSWQTWVEVAESEGSADAAACCPSLPFLSCGGSISIIAPESANGRGVRASSELATLFLKSSNKCT
jgi:hypothetical protein